MFCCVLLLLTFNAVVLHAQPGEPCAGTDPDASCPLDTWVFVLAGAMVIVTTVRLYQKKDHKTINKGFSKELQPIIPDPFAIQFAGGAGNHLAKGQKRKTDNQT